MASSSPGAPISRSASRAPSAGCAGGRSAPIGPFSFGWGLDRSRSLDRDAADRRCSRSRSTGLLFARLREKANNITVVMASFGASMALRSLLEFLFTSRPAYFSRELQIAMRFGWGCASPRTSSRWSA